MRNAYKIFVGKPQRKISHGRPTLRNRAVRWGLGSSGSGQESVADYCEHFNEPSDSKTGTD
jgi:hypothetical protein